MAAVPEGRNGPGSGGGGVAGPVRAAARVRSNSEAWPRARLLWLDAPSIAGASRPGQFVMVRCGEGQDPLLRRPLSIYRTDGSGGVALLFETVGKGTGWLSERAAGDPVDLVGPLGRGFRVGAGSNGLLLVAGGIGVAPLAFLAEEAAAAGRRVTVLLGARSATLLCPREHLPAGAAVVAATDDGSGGRKGPVTGLIGEFAGAAGQVFGCGPAAMYRAMAGLECLRGRSVQVSLEERMACGLGACYGCTVMTRLGPRQVCRDGPVFDLADIDWGGQ